MIKRFLALLIITFTVLVFCKAVYSYNQAVEQIIPDSNTRIIQEHELIKLASWELKVAKGEIYARHGKKFSSFDLRCYFANKGWYKQDPNYSDNVLNTFELKNIQTIKTYETKTKSKLLYKDLGCTFGRDKALKNNSSSSGYLFIISDSNKRFINDSELNELNTWELKVARNEIYARYGKSFDSEDLKCYFSNKNWYEANPTYTDYLLNNYEKKNIEKILNYEKKTKSKVMFTDKGCKFGTNKALE